MWGGSWKLFKRQMFCALTSKKRWVSVKGLHLCPSYIASASFDNIFWIADTLKWKMYNVHSTQNRIVCFSTLFQSCLICTYTQLNYNFFVFHSSLEVEEIAYKKGKNTNGKVFTMKFSGFIFTPEPSFWRNFLLKSSDKSPYSHAIFSTKIQYKL